MVHEAKLLGIWGSLVVGAALTASALPPVATVLLGLSMTAAGWLGHDYVHGVDDFSFKMRNFAALAAGLAPTWWSDKHNKHHALSESAFSSRLLLLLLIEKEDYSHILCCLFLVVVVVCSQRNGCG